MIDQPPSERWSILLTIAEPLTKEQRETVFTTICEATLPLEDALGIEIDVSGQPLDEVAGNVPEGPAQRSTGPHTHDPAEWCPDPWCNATASAPERES